MTARILVCEDDAAIARALQMKLARAGYDVDTVPDGLSGWELFEIQPPDLVITDYQMPRMDGLELGARIRNSPGGKFLPIVLLTAKSYDLEDNALVPALQLNEIIVKPFSPREVVSIVRRLLEESMVRADGNGQPPSTVPGRLFPFGSPSDN